MKKMKELFLKNKKRFVSITASICVVVFVGVVAGIISLSVKATHKHIWDEVVISEATCEQAGSKKLTCTVCGEVESEAIPIDPNAHKWQNATCLEPKTCALCEKTEGTKLDYHDFTEVSCTDDAKCRECGVIGEKALGHDWVNEHLDATCEEDGYDKFICGRCQTEDSDKYELLPAIGHAWEVDKTIRTALVDVCTNCGIEASEDLRFILQDDDTYAITGVGNNRDLGRIIIPSSYDGKPVSIIAQGAFEEYATLTSIIIIDPDVIIGDRAFANCKNLVSVELANTGEGDISIGRNAFEGCTSLKTVLLSDSVSKIGVEAFKGCVALEKVEMSANLLTIEDRAFADCVSLNSTGAENEFVLPAELMHVGYEAFKNCAKLKNVYVSEYVWEIPDSTFENCTGIETLVLPKETLIIGAKAFAGCKNLRSISLGEALENIGVGAFKDCVSLKSITFPQTLETIAKDAFLNCGTQNDTPMAEVMVQSLSHWCNIRFENGYANPMSVGAKLFVTESETETGMGIALTQIVIPQDIQFISSYAFYGYQSMETLTISENVVNIEPFAFAECKGLKKINYNAMFSVITEGNAFYNAGAYTKLNIETETDKTDALKPNATVVEVVVGEKVRTIPEKLFYTYVADETVRPYSYAAKITRVSFVENSNCETIGDYAFSNCNFLNSVEIGENVKTIGKKAFSNGLKESSSYNFLNRITIPDGIQSIGVDAFLYCDQIEEATLPADAIADISKAKLLQVTVTSGYVAPNAFVNSPVLKNVLLEDKVFGIGYRAFFDCPALESVKAGEMLSVVSDEAFAFDEKLTNFEAPALQRIEVKAFYACIKLEKIVLADTLQYIGKQAFALTDLKEVDFQNRYQWKVSGTDANGNDYSAKPLHDTDLAGRENAAKMLTDEKLYCNSTWTCKG